MADIRTLEPLVCRWRQVIDAPRHVAEKVGGTMTLDWLRGENVTLQHSIAENPMFPESAVLIMAADEGAEGDFAAHYFDSRAVHRLLHMSFQDGVWKWWRRATDPDDFDQRFEGTLSDTARRSTAPATSSKTANRSTTLTSETRGPESERCALTLGTVRRAERL